MVTKEQMDEFTNYCFGKPHGRVSKDDYCKGLMQLTMELEKLKYVIYIRDLFYNPCHESERLNKGIDYT